MVLGCVHGDGGSGLSRGLLKRGSTRQKKKLVRLFQGIAGNQPRSRVWNRLKVSDSLLVADEERHKHVHLPFGALVQDRHGF